MQLEVVGCLTLRYQEKMQMLKQRQRTGEQHSMRMVRRTCLNEKGVIKKQRGGFKYKKTKPSIFSFPTSSGIRTRIHFYTTNGNHTDISV